MIFIYLRVSYVFVILHFPTTLPSPYTLPSPTTSSSHPLNPQQTILLLFHNLCLFDFFYEASYKCHGFTKTHKCNFNLCFYVYHISFKGEPLTNPTFAYVNVGMLTFLNPPKQFLKVNSVRILLLFLFQWFKRPKIFV